MPTPLTPEQLAELGMAQPAEEKGGLYLRLKEGDKARIRICSKCHSFEETFEVEDKKTKVKSMKTVKKFGWIVLHKPTDGNGKINGPSVAKVYTCGPQVYNMIRSLAVGAWGNPMEYDIEIHCTGGTPFYNVQPQPDNMGAISDKQQAVLDAAGLDLAALCEGRESTGQSYAAAMPDPTDEQDPFADE